MRNSDTAYDKLIQYMVEGKIKCGQPINEKPLLEEFGVGRTPLREALSRLSQEGYVNVTPRKGVICVNLDLNDINQLFSLRTELTPYLCKQLIVHITDKQIRELEVLVNSRQFTDTKAADYDYFVRDIQFHNKLNAFADNKYLYAIMEKLQILTAMVFRPHYKGYMTNDTAAQMEYVDVLAALKAKDEQMLIEVFNRHIPKYVIQHG